MVPYATMLAMIALVCNAMAAELGNGSCDNHNEDAGSQLGQRSLTQSKRLEKLKETMAEEGNSSNPCSLKYETSDWFAHGTCGGCVGRNELGQYGLSLPECERKCLDDSFCVSFEFRKDCPKRRVSFSSQQLPQSCCQLSRTCTWTRTVQDHDDNFDFYEKRFPKLPNCQDYELPLGMRTTHEERNSGKCVTISEQQTCGWGYNIQETTFRQVFTGMFLYYKDDKQTELCLNALPPSKWESDVTLLCKSRECFVNEGKN